MHPEFAPIAFIAAFSLLLPLPWHWKAGSIATLAVIFWLFALNIIYAVDAVIWAGSVDNIATVWCDISTKVTIGGTIGPPAAIFCICIRLLRATSAHHAHVSSWESSKRRRQILEYSMCYILPMVVMILHYVVQGHRFDILEDYGCRAAIYFSLPSLFVIWVPGLAVSVGALICAGFALINLTRHYQSFISNLASTSSSFTLSHYRRLMAMSFIVMTWNTAVTAYVLGFNLAHHELLPWENWTFVHDDFSRVDQYPLLLIPPIYRDNFYIIWWIVPISTFLFVGTFAFGQESTELYKIVFSWIRYHILPSWACHDRHNQRPNGLPMIQFVRPATTQETFSDVMSSPKTSTAVGASIPTTSETEISPRKLEDGKKNEISSRYVVTL